MDEGRVCEDRERVIDLGRRQKSLLYRILNIEYESYVYILNLHSPSLAANSRV